MKNNLERTVVANTETHSSRVTSLEDDTKKLPITFKILLVEDEPMVQKVNKIMLEMMGYQVDVVTTGEQALQKFEVPAHYDCVLLDIALPGVSGLDVCKAIRQQYKNKEIPIVALTAFSHQALLNECKTAGVDKVLLKPANFDDLREVLHTMI